jgi:DNA segregation ATPase FtsK/SpoIIIE-like protein
LKRQSFKPFKQSDKLLYPIISDVSEFSAILAELRAETERRFAQFETYPAVETLADYNRVSDYPLPYLVMFVDEIAGILNGKDIQRDFLQLIQISRAAGIFIISAGQRWSHRIIDTNIRDQYRTRIHFATDDPNSSRMLLDSAAASEIDLQGRAFAKLPFGIEKSIIEVQAPYLDLDTVLQATRDGSGPQQEIPTLQPDPIAAQVLELSKTGQSVSAIAREVFKGDGGNQIKKVRAILEQFTPLETVKS